MNVIHLEDKINLEKLYIFWKIYMRIFIYVEEEEEEERSWMSIKIDEIGFEIN